jgi:prefoldin subunit 5
MRTTMQKNTLAAMMAVLTIVAVGLACSGLKDDTEAANKLIDEGNAAIGETTKLITDAQGKLAAMSDTKHFAESTKIAPELIKILDQAGEKCKTAAAKFDEASKLRVDEKFKSYLVAKVNEFNKRAELVEALKALPQIVIESKGGEAITTVKGLDALKSKMNAANKKIESVSKEAEDLADQSNRIQQENPGIFKN